MIKIFYAIVLILSLVSLIVNKNKTEQAYKIAIQKLLNILPSLLLMVILVSVVLYFTPDKTIVNLLGKNNQFLGVVLGLFFGSITLMPGFIAFPLAGILLEKGVLYMVLSAFTSSLMLVGILTYPIEKDYFGAKVTIMRNSISLVITAIIALATGLAFGELF
ncbi:MAG: permease [Candidatus Cloacimonetes bacterium]|nr:permease [Candidatus Cloacimonadota bacterium]MBS3767769.1 permease [Candidatus Cloacimonadota bacterium]